MLWKLLTIPLYDNNLAINGLNYIVRIFFLTLAEIDHKLNQLHSGLRKLESDALTIQK